MLAATCNDAATASITSSPLLSSSTRLLSSLSFYYYHHHASVAAVVGQQERVIIERPSNLFLVRLCAREVGLQVEVNGQVTLSVNSRNLFAFEQYRDKHPAPPAGTHNALPVIIPVCSDHYTLRAHSTHKMYLYFRPFVCAFVILSLCNRCPRQPRPLTAMLPLTPPHRRSLLTFRMTKTTCGPSTFTSTRIPNLAAPRGYPSISRSMGLSMFMVCLSTPVHWR